MAARARLGGSELVADHPCACFTTTVSVEGDVALTNPQITSSPVTKPTGTPWVAAYERVHIAFRHGLAVETHIREQSRERMCQHTRSARRSVVADEKGHVVFCSETLCHALQLRRSEQNPRPRIQFGVQKVVHRSVTVR